MTPDQNTGAQTDQDLPILQISYEGIIYRKDFCVNLAGFGTPDAEESDYSKKTQEHV